MVLTEKIPRSGWAGILLVVWSKSVIWTLLTRVSVPHLRVVPLRTSEKIWPSGGLVGLLTSQVTWKLPARSTATEGIIALWTLSLMALFVVGKDAPASVERAA